MNKKIIAQGAFCFAAIGIIGGCSTATKTSSSPPAQTKTPSSPAPASSSAPPSNPLSGPLNTAYKITDPDASGTNGNSTGTAVYDVTASQVLDPASLQAGDTFDAPPAGQHLVGVEFKIAGVSGTDSDAADNDAVVQGSNGQLYQADVLGGQLAAGTDFDGGQFSTSPGSSEVGWEAFAIPNGGTIRAIQWTPSSGSGGTTVTWTAGS